MHDQHREIDPLEICGEIGLGEGNDYIVVRFRASHHALTPPVVDDGLGGFGTGSIVTLERPTGEIAIEFWAVGRNLCLHSIEELLREAVWVRS
jgi:hypothetical protein